MFDEPKCGDSGDSYQPDEDEPLTKAKSKRVKNSGKKNASNASSGNKSELQIRRAIDWIL
jgi:hypothetical protein